MTALIPALIPLLGIWEGIMQFLSVLMQPLYAAISGIIVFWHWVLTPIFGRDSGVTWTLSILLLTAVVRTAMIPLFVKTIRSTRNMQLLQPKLAELQKKYGADRERLGQETMKLYKEEGINPMASCFPLLIQSPIFIALYRVLEGAARNTPRGWFFVRDHSLVDSLRHAKLFGANLSGTFLPITPFGPNQILAIVLILLMTVVLFITQLQMSQKNMTPEAMTGPFAQQQKIMLYGFPIFYAFSGIYIQIGVLLYWLASNLWTLVQQWLLIHFWPTPNTPAYADWEDRMRRRGLDPKEIERERQAKRAANKQPATSTTSGVARQNVDASRGRIVRTKAAPGQPVTTTPSATGTGSTAVRPSRRPADSPATTSEPRPATDGADAPIAEDTRRPVTRQQPQRQSRAVRRKK